MSKESCHQGPLVASTCHLQRGKGPLAYGALSGVGGVGVPSQVWVGVWGPSQVWVGVWVPSQVWVGVGVPSQVWVGVGVPSQVWVGVRVPSQVWVGVWVPSQVWVLGDYRRPAAVGAWGLSPLCCRGCLMSFSSLKRVITRTTFSLCVCVCVGVCRQARRSRRCVRCARP